MANNRKAISGITKQPLAGRVPDTRQSRLTWARSNRSQALLSAPRRALPACIGPLRFTFTSAMQDNSRPAALACISATVSPADVTPAGWLVLYVLGGWSYTNSGGYGLTAQNRSALITHLKERFVNAPWANGSALNSYQFAADGSIALNTKNLDDWLATWSGAQRYQIFVHVPTSIGGAKIGTSAFDKNVATWIRAWVAHLGKQGIRANQLALLLRDEPNESKDVSPIVAWSRALRAAEPEVVIWEDPTYRDPRKAPAPFWEACDVLCPNRVMWLAGGPAFEKFYLDQQAKGATLQFCSQD